MAEMTEDRIKQGAALLAERSRNKDDRPGNIEFLKAHGYSPADAQAAAKAYFGPTDAHGNKDWTPRALALDFDAVPDAPDWVVHGVIERGTVAMLSGDTGSAKSLVTSWLAVCALKGDDWLGCTTYAQRILVVDEENPDRLVRSRLRAMGLTNDERDGLRYYSREGFALGTKTGDAEFVSAIEEFRPDLVVIDTLMSTTDVDVNDNRAAVATMKWLRGIAAERGCAILILHHERKQHRDGPAAGSSQQSMGARQWAGQSDAMLTIAVESDMVREEQDEGFTLRRTFKMRLAEKDRDGRHNAHRRVAVESVKDDNERLVSMVVKDEGPISNATAKDDSARKILAALEEAGGTVATRRDLAAATGEKNADDPSGTWKRALDEQIRAGNVEKEGRRLSLTVEGGTYLLSLRATGMEV